MREIKFKVWNIHQKNFIENFCFHEFEDLNTHFENEDVIFLQFIGLKDKNGVEIYNHDIVEDDDNRLFEVVEDTRIGQTGYILKVIKSRVVSNGFDHLRIGQFVNFYDWVVYDNFLKIVGNKFQNSELFVE